MNHLAPPRHRRTLSTTVVDHTVAAAAAIVNKWHPDDDDDCSLFLDPSAHAEEASDFLRAAGDLHRAMLFFASDASNVHRSGSALVQAQALLDTAMRRLHLELKLLLSALSSSSKPLADNNDGDSITLRLRAVAEAMMAAGYGKECVSTFKARRRAALAATLQGMLGFSPTSLLQLHKLTWDQVDARMQSWLAAAPVAFAFLFAAERGLCDGVFAGDSSIGDAVLAAIAGDQAVGLLAVAEAAVARARRAPERLFRVLDVHDALTEALPEILSVFGYKSEVATRACAALGKAGQEARGALASFEAAIRKEPAKATAPGGAVHPLTRYVMNYLVFLADYDDALARIYQHRQADEVDTTSSSCSPELSSSSSRASSPIGWLVQVLLRKIDAKAGSYRAAAALRHLFLANNTHYVAGKVRGSSKLDGILGDGEWAEAHSAKARRHVEAYVREAWSKVAQRMSASSDAGGEGVEDAVMEAAATQERWVAADEEMGVALNAAATAAVVPAYRMFYRRHGAALTLTPGDVKAIIGELFGGFPTPAMQQQQQAQLRSQDADPRAQEKLLTY